MGGCLQVTRCEVIKKTNYNGKKQQYYGVDACMANLMRPGMYESYHRATPAEPSI